MCEITEHCPFTPGESCPFCETPSTVNLIQADIEEIIEEIEND